MGNRILSLGRNWIQRAFHTTFSTSARGVSIILHKSLHCTVCQVFSVPAGRYVAVVLEIDSFKLSLINVYVPPPFQATVLYSKINKFASHLPLKILIMGDFNSVLDYSLDTSNPSRAHVAAETVQPEDAKEFKSPLL